MGFLSGLDNLMGAGPEFRRRQALADEQAAYDLNKQRAEGLLGEQKAQARQDFMPLLRQLPTTAAAALGPLLTSNDPTIQAQGMQ